jgi:cation-transporting ATPase 13A1
MGIKPYPVYTYRCNEWKEIPSDELFPGDLISVVRTKEDSGLPCDAVLISGGCIVNEAMLSGESTPLLKESIALRPEDDILDPSGYDKNSLLYGGTKVLQTTPPSELHPLHAPDDGVLAIVSRTGFETSQGSLVRTMIYSTERVSANNLESLLFLLFLLVFAIVASWYVWVEGTPTPHPSNMFRRQK